MPLGIWARFRRERRPRRSERETGGEKKIPAVNRNPAKHKYLRINIPCVKRILVLRESIISFSPCHVGTINRYCGTLGAAFPMGIVRKFPLSKETH